MHHHRLGLGNPEVEARHNDIVFTVAEAALQLKIGRTQMYELVMSGAVRSITIGRSRRVPAQCIAEYVNQLLTNPVAQEETAYAA